MKSRYLLFFIVAISAPFSVYAQPAIAIGQVLQTRGLVQAEDSQGTIRDLRRRSEIFVGDHLITGPFGFVQMRLLDGAIIAIREDSEFHLKTYNTDGDPATPDQAILELTRGGFRTITGTIGDHPRDTYRLETPFANVSIDGTTYECAIHMNTLYCGVTSGAIIVSNVSGTLRLGLGGKYDYVEVSQGAAPRGLLQKPQVLGSLQSQSANPGGVGGNTTNNSTSSAVPKIDDGPIDTLSPANPPANAGSNPRFPVPVPIKVTPYKNSPRNASGP